ncbi:hypothetical protein MGA5115_03428 [Marinomonas gallaica]|uniref:WD domain, G-beta repeat n=1 Tax=Marinomonas gallaica TaxID=1806667 RepID=A0A1C3JW17_9GAMM|nr:hypothetical protein [Marinomonas gallaica]SBT19266.1 hypothetical protein MGA5115_03428 [Marinomonas gallaica]SBT20955.1 hypothetical protein MGA5116_01542 [Marinomonas gallaica]
MRRTAKALKHVALAGATLALLGACSAEDPVTTSSMAVQGLYSAALSDNGSASLIGSIQHGGSYWENNPSRRVYNWNHAAGEATPLISVDIDPSGDFAATGSARTMVLWSTVTGQSLGFWNTPGDVKTLKLTRNGDFALVGMDDQTARYFDVKNGGIRQTLRTGAIVRSVDVTPDGRYGVTGDDLYQVILWDLTTGEAKHRWQLDNNIATVTLSGDGAYVFAAAQLGDAKVWSTLTGAEVSQIDTGKLQSRNVTISQAVFSNNNRNLLLGQQNRRVNLVNVMTGEVTQSWDMHLKDTMRPTGAAVIALAFGAGNTYYAIGSNGYLNVFQ